LAGAPVVAVLAAERGDTIVVPESERDRLVAEELLPEDAGSVLALDWQEPVASAAVFDGVAGEASLAAELRAARASLLPAETGRFEALGADVASALTAVAATADSTVSERELAARVGEALLRRGIDPLVVLVAGEGRLAHRHPLPTSSPLGPRAMIVVCGRRHGLIANATRWVSGVGEPEGQGRILAVEAAYLRASVPGARLNDVLAAGAAAYAANGFAADEWRRHHQGGAAGYAGRDPRATEATGDVLHLGQAMAWNPSGPGVKVEDTVLIGEAGVRVLTADPAWPTVSVQGLARPAAWEMAR